MDQTLFPPCEMCSVCRDDVNNWPPLCMQGIQLVVSDIFNTIQGRKNLKNVCNELKKYPNAQKHLFRINSNAPPKPKNLNKMLFLLIAWEIINLTYEEGTDDHAHEVTLSLKKVSPLQSDKCLMDETFWNNILRRKPIVDYNSQG